MTTFAELGLPTPILKALEAEGYTTPTPIQAQAIPHVLLGRDVQGIAQTGTGKTAAFALPILQRLMADKRPAIRRGCRVLVLSPTRELASQIAESFRVYGRNTGLRTALMFGGVPKARQAKAVAGGIDILVATPGRLLDHMQDGAVTVSGTEILVLDEADHMLDLGFIVPIRKIVGHISIKRQTLFFSATMPKEIAALAGNMLRDPVHVAVTPVAKTADRVEQKVIFVEAARKRQVLAEILRDKSMGRTLVFTRTKHGADKVTHHLEAVGQSGGGNPWQQEPAAARAGVGGVPRRPYPCAGRDRHRGARHRRGRRNACDQFRPAERAGSVCAPDRPDRAGGARRDRDQLLRQQRAGAPARDREADQSAPASRGAVGARRLEHFPIGWNHPIGSNAR